MRGTTEYKLAERIIHLERALKIANGELKKRHSLGVGTDFQVSFREASKFHKEVREIIKKYKD